MERTELDQMGWPNVALLAGKVGEESQTCHQAMTEDWGKDERIANAKFQSDASEIAVVGSWQRHMSNHAQPESIPADRAAGTHFSRNPTDRELSVSAKRCQ